MTKTRCAIIAGVILWLVGGLSACSGLPAPRQIASYPRSTPSARFEQAWAYDMSLELEVSDVEAARVRILQMVSHSGGMLLDSNVWEQDGCNQARLVLSIPAYFSDSFRERLLDLGRLVDEDVSRRPVLSSHEAGADEVYYVVDLRQSCSMLAVFQPSGWRPVQTLSRAWSVFVSIFSFLLDILIWIAIVLGPFILIGLGIWAIIRWYRAKRVSRM